MPKTPALKPPTIRPRHSKKGKPKRPAGQLSANAAALTVTITAIGHRGDGVGEADYSHDGKTATRKVFVPDSAVGDVLRVQPRAINSHGINADLLEVLTPSQDRQPPPCPSSPACGGCQFQHLTQTAYQDWKTAMVKDTLARTDVYPTEWRAPYAAAPATRRRARFAWRRLKDEVVIGFRGRSSHQIIPLKGCIILAPELITAMEVARDQLLTTLDHGQKGELDITLCDNGWDMTIHPEGEISYAETTALITAASSTSNGATSGGAVQVARLSIADGPHEVGLVTLNQQPRLTWPLPSGATGDSVTITPAASTFLQAEPGAEALMAADVYDALEGYGRVVDLFCGSGTLSLPLLHQPRPPKELAGYDAGENAIAVMVAGAKNAGLAQRLTARPRNLVETPLETEELNGFDAAIVDPPRSGAARQMPALAASTIGRIIMVSCNPRSFARDAAVLIDGGYQCSWARVVDQFLLTAHAEVVACFDKAPADTINAPSMFA